MDNDLILYATDDGDAQFMLREIGGRYGLPNWKWPSYTRPASRISVSM